MRKSSGSEEAASSVVGVILLVGLTVIMVAAIAISVASVSGFMPPESAPQVKIVAVEVKGGLPPAVAFEDNSIILKHKGGDSLDIKKIKIILYGNGRSHRSFGGEYVPPYPGVGKVQVVYLNLTKYGKITDYNNTNSLLLQDGFWSAGESLILSGDDSLNANDDRSSVWVTVNGDGDTANNYGFKVGEKIYINIIDTVTEEIISTASAIVQP